MKKRFLLALTMAVAALGSIHAEVDPNFHIYLCFGQSNMEGNASPEAVDKENVDPRFQMLATANDFSNPQRTMGQWYTATPPIVRQWAGMGMSDYFGRSMVAALPANVKVGVVAVAIGGIAIDGFSPDQATVNNYLSAQPDWMKNTAAIFGNFPYQRLVDMAKIAQQSGVIKGILLHQGESDNGQQVWLQKVKNIYDHLLADLNLQASEVPLFAGETVNADMGGACSLHNSIIAQLPTVIANAHVVRSNGCPCVTTPDNDHIHFTAAGYRTMGKRYAIEALEVMGQPAQAQAGYSWNANQRKIYACQQLDGIDDITLRVGGSKTLTVWASFEDGHKENVTPECTITSNDFTIEGTTIKATAVKQGTVKVAYTDFLGQQKTLTINVTVSDQGPNHVLVDNNGTKGTNAWDKEVFCNLATPMQQGKTYVVRATMKADQEGGCALWPRWDASTNRDQWGNSADIQYEASYNLNSNWQELTWQFKANFPHDVLIFAVGQIGGKVYFDDVSCKELNGDVEMIANGTFESDNISDWYVLTWTGQSLSVQEDNTLGIESIEHSTLNIDHYYNLNGQYVAHPTKGLYIVNGRKVIIK